jgi:membrane protein YdbS with pleckstrin-like domain
MSRHAEEATAWVYRGVWGVLTRWFRVPEGPPSAPGERDEESRSFRPSDGFLRYLKFKFWIGLFVIDLAILTGWLVLFVSRPTLALLLAPVAFAVAVFPDVVAYVAIHLRYDTTWYVFTSRSLRIRRGIWIIHETTITFENIQNVSVHSGPLERYFGIANVTVDTAGGGQSHKEKGGHETANYHQGVIEGIDDANAIRNQILMRVRRSASAGLGDEHTSAIGWSPAHVALLREIRDLLSQT